MITLLTTILLWATLATWRELVLEKLHRLEVSNIHFYLDYTARTGERPAPVRWGDRVIVPPASGSQEPVQWNEPYLGVANRMEGMWLNGGSLLSRIPVVLFHSAFALLALTSALLFLQQGSA